MIDRKFFYDTVRIALFGGALENAQVYGLGTILSEWDTGHWGDDKRKLAYMLATTFHETGHKMTPVTENGAPSYFNKYEPGTKLGKQLGNTLKGDGARYKGRGFVQITGRGNYQKAGGKLDVDLINQPEKALELPIATRILFAGMSEGWFTGRKLSQYFNDTTSDYLNARKIINGLDCYDKIAAYAQKFRAALR